MPDIFGNPTPQEVQQSILEAQRQRQADFARSPTSTAQSSSVIGDALGSAFRKTRDTRSARKSESERLREEDPSLTEDQIKAIAKENVPRDFAPVQAARQLEKVGNSARTLVDSLSDRVDPVMARIIGRNVYAAELSRLGMTKEAQNQRLMAKQEFDAEQVRLEAMKDVKSVRKAREKSETKQFRVGNDFVTYKVENDGSIGEELFRSAIDRVQETRDVTNPVTDTQASKDITAWRDMGMSTVVNYTTGAKLLDIVSKTPEALGKSGDLARFGNNFLITAKNIGKALHWEGMEETRVEKSFDFSSFDDGFMKNAAVESSIFRSGILNIAVASVAAIQGRVSDKDIQLKIDELGGASSDFDAFSGTIRFSMDTMNDRLNAYAEVFPLPDSEKARVFEAVSTARTAFDLSGRSSKTYAGFTMEQILQELTPAQAQEFIRLATEKGQVEGN